MSRFFRRGAAPTEVSTSETTTSTSQTIDPTNSSTLKSDSNPNPSPSTSLITKPIPNWKRSPPPSFTKEEDEKLNSLKKYAQDLHEGKESTAEELKQDYKPFERKWLDDEHLYVRYLRAAKWDFENAKKRIKGTLEWRRSFQPDIIVPSSVSIEGETGKHVISGFDHFGRPVLYLRPGRENTKPSDRQIRYLVWSLERALDFAPKGVEKIIIFVDFKAATNQTNPGLGTALKVLNILQNHYVERLGRAIVVNLPWVLKAFMAGITPFLDPVTKDKIRFNPPVLSELIPQEQLDKQFGGDYEYQFDFEKYWSTLTDFCGIGEDGKRVHEPYSKTQDDSNVPVAVADDDLQPTTSIGNEGQTISKFLHSSRKQEDDEGDEDDFQDADNENEVEKEDGLESQTTSRAPTLVGLNNGNGNGNAIGGNGVKPLVEDSNRVESANQQVA